MQTNDWDLPPPPGVEPVMPPRTLRWVVAALILVGLIIAASVVPIPSFYALLPGPVRDVEPRVTVEGARTYSSEGQLLLVTVSVDDDVTFTNIIESMFNPSIAIISREDFTQGRSIREIEREAEAEMAESKRHAQEVVLGELGYGHPEGDGARIVAIPEGAPAEGRLRPGDVIVAVDGEPVETTCDVGRRVDDHPAGDEVRVTVRRRGVRKTVTVVSGSDPNAPDSAFLGIFMEDVNYRFDPDLEIEFDTDEIGGPSAGLMFALTLYDQLTPEDLTGGRSVAGTGEIACDGGIGQIGGVEQKVVGAERKGAEVFLAPVANAEAAERVADDIEVVAVANFRDALEYLQDLD